MGRLALITAAIGFGGSGFGLLVGAVEKEKA